MQSFNIARVHTYDMLCYLFALFHLKYLSTFPKLANICTALSNYKEGFYEEEVSKETLLLKLFSYYAKEYYVAINLLIEVT